MSEAGSPAGRSLLRYRLIRIPLKLVLGAAVFGVAVFAAAALYNTFDADLSAEATALLAPQPMGNPDDNNGFIAFLGMQAPKGQDPMDWGRKAAAAFAAQARPGFTESPAWREATRSQITNLEAWNRWCSPDCLTEAKRDGKAVAMRLADSDNIELLARYRVVRAAPEFADIYAGELLFDTPGNYVALDAGATLALAEGAMKAIAGNPGALVTELEREVAFHRRIITGGRVRVSVLNGETMLTRDLLAVSALLRSGGAALTPYRSRLHALTRPPSSVTAIRPAFRHAAHEEVNWALHYHKFLRGSSEYSIQQYDTSPIMIWALDLFVRPNETANLVAARMNAEASIADVPAAQFEREAAAIRAANDALLTQPWYALWLHNPVGKQWALALTVRLGNDAARMHDLQALERMVDLQMTLAERGVTDSAAIAAFVAAEGAKSHPDPYTEKAFAFDPVQRLLSFEPRAKEHANDDLKKRDGGKITL